MELENFEECSLNAVVSSNDLKSIFATMRGTSPMKVNGWSPKYRPSMTKRCSKIHCNTRSFDEENWSHVFVTQ